MSTQQDAHETEVRRIAEILAFFRYKKETYFSSYFTEDDKKKHWDKFDGREYYIKGKEEEAHAMVAEMENKVILVMTSVLGSSDSAKMEISIILSVFGLIPSQTETGEK